MWHFYDSRNTPPVHLRKVAYARLQKNTPYNQERIEPNWQTISKRTNPNTRLGRLHSEPCRKKGENSPQLRVYTFASGCTDTIAASENKTRINFVIRALALNWETRLHTERREREREGREENCRQQSRENKQSAPAELDSGLVYREIALRMYIAFHPCARILTPGIELYHTRFSILLSFFFFCIF